MKTKPLKLSNHIATTNNRRLTTKRKALLQSYFTNAVVLAALLETAQQDFRSESQFL
jgi:hypothetical protein